MRIAITSGWLFLPPYCGTRKLVYQTAIGLGERGHRVMLVMLGERWEVGTKISRGNVDIITIPLGKKTLDLYCAAGVLLQKIFGFAWAPIANLIRSRILELFCSAEFQNQIALFNPEVIMAEDMYAAPVSSIVARELDIAFVYRVHHIYSAIYTDHPFESLLMNWESSLMRNTDLILTLTEDDAEEVNRMFGISAEVSGYGVNLEDTNRNVKSFGLAENEYVLYVSSYLGKEVEWLKKAASLFPNTVFVFAGQGSLALTKLPQNIRRLGLVSERDLSALYKHCKFVLMPLEWKAGKGIPIKLIEAVKSNKPILIYQKASWLLKGITEGIYTFTEKDFHQKMEVMLQSQTIVTRTRPLFGLDASIERLEMKLATVKKLAHTRGYRANKIWRKSKES